MSDTAATLTDDYLTPEEHWRCRPTLKMFLRNGLRYDKDAYALTLQLNISQADCSMWRTPIYLQITDIEHTFENCMNLSREDARIIRDWLDVLLRTPDWRE